MDFMNLNQSAHGDREFGYLATRMRLRAQDRCGALDASRASSSGSAPGRARPAAGTRRSRSSCPLRRQHAPGRGHGRRQGRGADSPRRLGQRVRRRRARRGGRRRGRRERRRAGLGVRGRIRARSRAERRAASSGSRCATRRESRPACAEFLEAGGFKAFTDHLRGSRRAAPAARDRGAAADGRRLRVRRGGRLEDGGSRSRREGDERRASRVAPRSWRTTPTIWRRAIRRCSARTCSRSARRSAATSRAARSIRSRSAPARIRCGSSSRPRPGRRSSWALLDLGNRFRLVANEVEVVAPERGAPASAGRARDLEAEAELRHCRRGVARGGWPSPHELHAGADDRGAYRPRRDRRRRDRRHRRAHHRLRPEAGAPLEPRLLPPGRRAVARWPTMANCRSGSSRGTASSSARGSSFSRSAT